MAIAESHIEWTMPAPLWPAIGDPSLSQTRLQFRTPTLLRFSNDDFMDEFHDLLASDPHRLTQYVAAPETWKSPALDPPPPIRKRGFALKLERAREKVVERLERRGALVVGAARNAAITAAQQKTLKLYQPAHQRFYLVSACLVCRTVGLPDRVVDAGADERVTFVMRLLQPRPGADPHNPDPHACDEYALVSGAWQKAANPESLIAGEQPHPLSPAGYTEDDRRRRRLFIGLVPAADRENLLKAALPASATVPPVPLVEARQMLLKTQVLTPWNSLELLAKGAFKQATVFDPAATPLPTQAQKQSVVDNANQQIQAVSWYILLDLARFFEAYIPDLWHEIQTNGSGASLTVAARQTLLHTLSQTSDTGVSLKDALKKAYAAAGVLESVKTRYSGSSVGWPNFQFQFVRLGLFSGVQGLTPALARDTFENQVKDALGPDTSPQPLPVRLVARANANPQAPVWFAIRCVLERPNCGALCPPFLSEPTAAFQLAAFFDPDAPARPIRIGLPIDTTPAGLRKFDKNTAFVMSDVLCGQVSKMGGMSFADLIFSVLPFPFHKDLDSSDMQPCGDPGGAWGMVCSFSIPIITICALFLLIIFIKLFDIIFFWMPFFQICLPLPLFSAKDS